MWDIFFIVLAVAGVAIASVTDLKKGIVPNKLSFPLIGIGVAGNSLYALYSRDISLLASLVKSISAIFIVGYLFWVLGGWSAGDAKEFLFLAALLPRYPSILRNYFTPSISPYPFVLTILINTFLLAFPFLLLYSILVSYTKLSLLEFLKPLRDMEYIKGSFFLTAAITFGWLLGRPIFAVPALIVLYAPVVKDTYKYAASGLLLAFFVISQDPLFRLEKLAVYFVVAAFFFAFLSLLWNTLKILRDALKEEAEITGLSEGKSIAEEIYIQNGKIVRDKRSIIERVKALAKSKEERRAHKERVLIAVPRAAGLTMEEITTLKRYVKDGRLEDQITVKKSMPFAPVILFGLLFSLVSGDILGLLR
ncbi:MAG: A24 family peptidase C-terminal domain-containing protein [Candidatus Hydrothermarchaeales archaeon]